MAEDKADCWSQCFSYENCLWFSFAPDLDNVCILFKSECSEFQDTESGALFESGMRQCNYVDGDDDGYSESRRSELPTKISEIQQTPRT